jgi:hypothetical protein
LDLPLGAGGGVVGRFRLGQKCDLPLPQWTRPAGRLDAMMSRMLEGSGDPVGSAAAEQALPRTPHRSTAGALRSALASRPWISASVGAWLISRCIVFAAGIAAFLALGNGPDASYDFLGLTGHLGAVGDALAAPVIHWDGVWYLALAAHGYQHSVEAAYYPLYPLLVSLLAPLTGSNIVASFVISAGCLLGALALLHRLASLEMGEAAAARTLYLIALFPTALFFSATYPESLFLLLEVGAVLAARRERWASAGMLGGLAAAARNSGVLLLIPLLLLYLYGPRSGRSRQPAAGVHERRGGPPARLRIQGLPSPRYRLRPDVCWLGLVPLGLIAVMLMNLILFNDPLASWHAEAHWQRGFAGPLSALWEGISPAATAAGHLLSGHLSSAALQQLALLGTALLALAAVVGVCRRLPAAYGAYSAAALLWALSAPEQGHPLASSARYVLTIFPLFMWAGSRLTSRRALAVMLGAFVIGLVYCSARFATWHWVA